MNPTARHSTVSSASIYIHIPFCERKCIYCDFYSIENVRGIDEFIPALHREIDIFSASQDAGQTCRTVFLGGGTPSLLAPAEIERLMVHLSDVFAIEEDAEITLEANPGTIDLEKLRGYREAGVNRVSFGIQSFHQDELEFLGRIHSVVEGREAVLTARKAGFENINVDLIYALPGQSMTKWRGTVRQAVDLEPKHISAYCLIVEPNTPLARLVRTGQVRPTPSDKEAEFFEHTIEFLRSHGFQQYEVSNFAQPGFRSRHNLNYWRHGSYFGFGPSAHSFRRQDEAAEGHRWWNVSNVTDYSSIIRTGRLPVAGSEAIPRKTLMVERLLLGLRSDGVDLVDFRRMFGPERLEKHRELLDELVERELVSLTNDKLKLTSQGYLLCDEVAAQLTG